MLSKPDFIEKQIVLIETNNFEKLKFKNSNIIITDEKDKIVFQHPCTKIFMIFILGEFSITSILIKNLKKYAIPIVFLNYNLRPYFSIVPDNKGNFLLREKQYKNNRNLEIAKHIIYNKINNQLSLMNSLRYKSIYDKENISNLKRLLEQIKYIKDDQELLGVEGTASKLFFPWLRL